MREYADFHIERRNTMRLLSKMIHKDVTSLEGRAYERQSARGIILRGCEILLMYTKRYNDYSFPGGGIEPNEDAVAGLRRELAEETGAAHVEVLDEFGYIDEYRPHSKPDYELIHMVSYFYVCRAEADFSRVQLEDYEVANGSVPVWIDIREAIAHNKAVMADPDASVGFSIGRETLVLERIMKELV
jgi:8-oxo-dGTP pyrophosphatase MutT (NUDIX family)